MLRGVDIAGSYQAGFDVARARREDGIAFCVAKITEGLSEGAAWDVTNKTWAARWYAQCQAAGVVFGAYHWLHAGSGAAQARYFLTCLNRITGRGAEGVLVQLDNESDAGWADTVDFCREWARITGGHPLDMYTGDWWWAAPGRGWPGIQCTPYLWHSHYLWDATREDARRGTFAQLEGQVPAWWWVPGYGGWPRATFLQWTSRGTCGGLTNNVDLNTYDGTVDTLRALTTVQPPEVDVTPEQDKMLTEVHALLMDGAWFGDDPQRPGQPRAYLPAAFHWVAGTAATVGAGVTDLTVKVDTLLGQGTNPDSAAILARLDDMTAGFRTVTDSLTAAVATAVGQIERDLGAVRTAVARAARAEADSFNEPPAGIGG